ncbi:RND transporter [Polluticoccus soli]|uniref:RND transporter n=1 Tax=Polluticoccus soli TaxID=3034150 RepID=UPI0023E30F69|nr:RND transporter [Flavipsychrobacter sp. JY13-12]
MKKNIFIALFISIMLATGCHTKSVEEEEVSAETIQTPVTVTSIAIETIADYVDLNATSTFLTNSFIKSTANGYIEAVNLKPGQYVRAHTLAFVVKTKEARALGNLVNRLDPSFRFTGIIRIYTAEAGYVSEVSHQVGDYVQDGEQIAVINDARNFGFLLNLPYELKHYIGNNTIDLVLPDKSHLQGRVIRTMPEVDSFSQTEKILIGVGKTDIPKNLIATVHITKDKHEHVQVLPKETVLTDESQAHFWVMKMIDSVRAVKVPVMKGLESNGKIEIIRPVFSLADKILLTGNYGLPDTARVKIIKVEKPY